MANYAHFSHIVISWGQKDNNGHVKKEVACSFPCSKIVVLGRQTSLGLSAHLTGAFVVCFSADHMRADWWSNKSVGRLQTVVLLRPVYCLRSNALIGYVQVPLARTNEPETPCRLMQYIIDFYSLLFWDWGSESRVKLQTTAITHILIRTYLSKEKKNHLQGMLFFLHSVFSFEYLKALDKDLAWV